MKITNASGEDYDLPPGLTLEIERTNPFFNDYGEQSLPVTLPPTAKNRRLLSYPDDIRGLTKSSQRANVMLSHGAYAMRCRQAILSGNKSTGIETSFYLNTGAFYEKYQDVSLSDIFGEKTIPFNSVADAIQFCKGLYTSYNEQFACFPVRLDDATLNQFRFRSTSGTPPVFVNEEATSMEVDGKTIYLDPGYYITPFIRANYLLKEVLSYFGYTLLDNFFTETEPFKSMVFLNNNIDTLVKSEIRYVQIIPDCMVSTLLNMYRNLFCCEFIPDEVNRTIEIRLFDSVLADRPVTDLTPCMARSYTVDHPAKFRQLKLSANYVNATQTFGTSLHSDLNRDNQVSNFKNLRELLLKHPDAEYDPLTGSFIRYGFRGIYEISQIVGYVTCDYYAGGVLETEEKKADCTIPTTVLDKRRSDRESQTYLSVFVGSGRALNSTIVMDSEAPAKESETGDDQAKDAKNEELPLMPSFVVRHSSGAFDQGTTMNCDDQGTRLFDYILAHNGPDGLFERFWRNYDTLLRNSFLKVKVPLLLPETEKLQLSEYKKILLDGQELFPDKIRFIANKMEVVESDFYTTKLYTPLSTALPEAERLPVPSPYKWTPHWELHSPDPTKQRVAFVEESIAFYKPPTAAQFYQGGRFHQRECPVLYYARTSTSGPVDPVEGTMTVWLTAALK